MCGYLKENPSRVMLKRPPAANPAYTIEPIDWARVSAAFREFFHHFFVDSRGLQRREVDLAFLRLLSPEELALARALLRRNLHLRYTHLIEGLGEIGDETAAEELRRLLHSEADLSRKITIGRALWRLQRDPVFRELLLDMARSKSNTLKEAHIDDALLLGDEQALQILGTLLEDRGDFVRALALSRLNGIEARKHFLLASRDLPHDATYYGERLRDTAFVREMVENLRSPIAEWPVVKQP